MNNWKSRGPSGAQFLVGGPSGLWTSSFASHGHSCRVALFGDGPTNKAILGDVEIENVCIHHNLVETKSKASFSVWDKCTYLVPSHAEHLPLSLSHLDSFSVQNIFRIIIEYCSFIIAKDSFHPVCLARANNYQIKQLWKLKALKFHKMFLSGKTWVGKRGEVRELILPSKKASDIKRNKWDFC